MNQYVVFLFCSLFVFGFVCADTVSSSIVCSGASWVSSSVLGKSTSLTQDLFTTDPATIFRELVTGERIQAKVVAQSAGPMGIDEYSSVQEQTSKDPWLCIFDNEGNQTKRSHETYVLGLMQQGEYSSVRIPAPEDITRYLMEINGSGIILTRSFSGDSNQTLTHASDVAGIMNITELMQFGEKDGD